MDCDICGFNSDDGPVQFLNLQCSHNYCIDCALNYVKLGGPTRKLTFNHLFCPFRCGCSFASEGAAMAHQELGPLIVEQTKIMDKVNAMALAKFRETNKQDLSQYTRSEILQLAIEEASYFMCDLCEEIYWKVEECGAAGSSDAEKEYLCGSCSAGTTSNPRRRRQLSPAVSLWKESCQQRDALFRQNATSRVLDSVELCMSDYNASEQVSELQVLESIYPESVQVLTAPPTAAGEPCAVYVFQIPSTELTSTNSKISSEAKSCLLRFMDQIRIVFKCTAGYPSVAEPVIFLQIGDLSMLEMTSTMKQMLSAALVSGFVFLRWCV